MSPAPLLLYSHILLATDPVGHILTPANFGSEPGLHLPAHSWYSVSPSTLQFCTSRYLGFGLLHVIVHLRHHTAFHSLLLISCYLLGIMPASFPLWWKKSGLNQLSSNVFKLVCRELGIKLGTNNNACGLICLLSVLYKYIQIPFSNPNDFTSWECIHLVGYLPNHYTVHWLQ